MIFHHRKTKKPALWITAYDPSWKNQDDPNLFRIKNYEDLPFTEDVKHIYSQLFIPPEIWENQGRRGLYHYLRAFFMDNWCRENKKKLKNPLKLRKIEKEARKAEKDFWFMFLPSGFPNGVIE